MNIKSLVINTTEKFDSHVQQQLSAKTRSTLTVTSSQPYHPQTFAEALVNFLPYANPILAAREGIKVGQFMLEGIDRSSKVGVMNMIQLKSELNRVLECPGLKGKGIHLVLPQK